MRLPNADRAYVDRSKAMDYLLNPAHPDGAGKAQFFRALGFRREDWETFARSLKSVAARSPVTNSLRTVHGWKYIVDGALDVPGGAAVQVRTIWICDTGADIPRLVTAYPLEE